MVFEPNQLEHTEIIVDASRLATCVHDECARLARPPRGAFVGLKQPTDGHSIAIDEGFSINDPTGHLLMVRHHDVLSLLHCGSFHDGSALQVNVLLGPGVL